MKVKQGILNFLREKKGALLEDTLSSVEEDEEEVTQKTALADVDSPLLFAKEADECCALLEPLFFQSAISTFKNRRVLYMASPAMPYLSLIRGESLGDIVCAGPVLSLDAGKRDLPPFVRVLSEFSESPFAQNSFDTLILSEATCKGIHFITRRAYWASLLKERGEIYIALPHPDFRFLLATAEARHKSSKTATFERVVECARSMKLEIADLREITASSLPNAAIKGRSKWRVLKESYGEWPVILGLVLKKKEA